MNEASDSYDVVVVGGGAAGLNGALMLARSRRSVLVVDSGAPRNAPAEAIHGLLGHDGAPPQQLLERGREEVRRYEGRVVEGEVVSVSRARDLFVVQLADGKTVGARRLLVTTGVVDELPDIPGVRERWGKDVLHCPYCHGWEVRDKKIGVLGTGPNSVHQALLFRQLTDDVIYFGHRIPPDTDQARRLGARSIRVIDGDVESLEIAGDRLRGVRLATGDSVQREVAVVSTRLRARTGFLESLGLKPTEHPSGLGEYIKVDASGMTDVNGVWAAGNVTDPAAQVGNSAAAGAWAGARINADLVEEDTAKAIDDK